MNAMYIIIALTIVAILVIATCFIVEKFQERNLVGPNHSKTIYAIMVTGQKSRRRFLPMALKTFQMQSKEHSNITEIMVEKEKNGLTLGDLRNVALARVPADHFWVTFDDDDMSLRTWYAMGIFEEACRFQVFIKGH
ncbi:hypothetical protein BDK51DRAFT_27524 [Blyttiomyces helicus]|uniref:Uncharacterized protein n=1 Tax=Blyttiomyces helicus TaxID=388810 RepID=A0A4P9WC43_9FUNG|nr:hypothetical protein BDK51DRAFT_27524 [Blyttiomyces helicus]|eukprot:RKO88758.1 hypothetical protein BDK51DRAFT_27524 [Blyttiomyces helicus]